MLQHNCEYYEVCHCTIITIIARCAVLTLVVLYLYVLMLNALHSSATAIMMQLSALQLSL
jgi:hypothetical protein